MTSEKSKNEQEMDQHGRVPGKPGRRTLVKAKVWAVMISFENHEGVTRTGYHSVWKTKEMAEHQAKIRNNAGFRMRYTVEEKEGTLMSHALLKGTIKFDDSVGAMIIQEYKPWEMENVH